MLWIAALVVLAMLGFAALLRWGMFYGSTSEERALRLPGDDYFDGGPHTRVVMTRAISIHAPVESVWPWVGQLGRGAGWCSVDWLDNGRKESAWHIVSWIPEPRPGDATAIGYLREIDDGRSVTWWLGDANFIGSKARLVTCYCLFDGGQGTRLISRIAADAAGPTAGIALFVLRVIDSIMACRQLIGLRQRVEYAQRSDASPKIPETGARDQYQLYEIRYADGEAAGVAGKEGAARSRQAAIRDGVLDEDQAG